MKRILLAGVILLGALYAPVILRVGAYTHVLWDASSTLVGKAQFADVATDIYGFRAMLFGADPYAVLGPALKTIGVAWDLDFPSTHPPTAFLIVSPVALLPWPLASLLWAWLMLTCLVLSLRAVGFHWATSILLSSVALFWPPMVYSLGQITAVWLAGTMLGFKYRTKNPFWAGAFIALASFTKLIPALMMLPFLRRRNWTAIGGFVATWLGGLLTILIMAPHTLLRYMKVSAVSSALTIARQDNASVFPYLNRMLGTPGIAIAALLLVLYIILSSSVWRPATISGEISLTEWYFYAYLCVVILPILWIYSILPLFPVLADIVRRKGIPGYFAMSALAVPLAAPPYGRYTHIYLMLFLIFTAISLIPYLRNGTRRVAIQAQA